MFTFCVLGHNEAPTVLRALTMAKRAANPDDIVVFVDSASDDGSAALAAEAGYQVITAPIGKGRATRAALEAATTQWTCLLDADIFRSDWNIALALAKRSRDNDIDMVVGDFTEPGMPSILSNTWAIYEPLISALFPEVVGIYGSKPLSGFRALRTSLDLPDIPDDFGVEAYLNLVVPLCGKRSTTTPIGKYQGRFRYKPTMGFDIADAILKTATHTGRLTTHRRAEWDTWVAGAVETISKYRGQLSVRDEYLARLREVASRPLPPTGM
ncbi:MAG: glycosyltransferase family 2 protein [Pseudonocardiaceae bacterium]